MLKSILLFLFMSALVVTLTYIGRKLGIGKKPLWSKLDFEHAYNTMPHLVAMVAILCVFIALLSGNFSWLFSFEWAKSVITAPTLEELTDTAGLMATFFLIVLAAMVMIRQFSRSVFFTALGIAASFTTVFGGLQNLEQRAAQNATADSTVTITQQAIGSYSSQERQLQSELKEAKEKGWKNTAWDKENKLLALRQTKAGLIDGLNRSVTNAVIGNDAVFEKMERWWIFRTFGVDKDLLVTLKNISLALFIDLNFTMSIGILVVLGTCVITIGVPSVIRERKLKAKIQAARDQAEYEAALRKAGISPTDDEKKKPDVKPAPVPAPDQSCDRDNGEKAPAPVATARKSREERLDEIDSVDSEEILAKHRKDALEKAKAERDSITDEKHRTVIEMVDKGKSDKEIMAAIGYSERTIRRIKRLYGR